MVRTKRNLNRTKVQTQQLAQRQEQVVISRLRAEWVYNPPPY